MVGNDTAIEILIRSFRRLGLAVDHVSDEGVTALLVAARSGFIECATLLAVDGRANVSLRDAERGLNAEAWARARGCTSPEVLPLSESGVSQGQLRLSRCVSLYAPRPSHGGGDGDDVVVDVDVGDGGGDDGTAAAATADGGIGGASMRSKKQTTVGPIVEGCPASGAAAAAAGGTASAATRPQKLDSALKGKRIGGGAFRGSPRRRNSLPTIKLHSSASVELPPSGGWGSGELQLQRHGTAAAAAAAEQLRRRVDGGGGSGDADAHGSTDKSSVSGRAGGAGGSGGSGQPPGQQHAALAARRSRELARANTEVVQCTCNSDNIP